MKKDVTGQQALAMRQKKRMNQKEFWSRVGVTQSGGSRYESGRNIPKPASILLKIVYGSDKVAERIIQQLRAE